MTTEGPNHHRLISVLSPAAMLGLWEGAVAVGLLDHRFFPPPSVVAATFWHLLAGGELLRALAASLLRISTGFAVGAGAGLALGLVMGLVPVIRAALAPVVAALYPIPKLALLPLIMLVFGLGEASKIVTIAMGVFFLVLINTVSGVVNIDPIFLDVARNYGARGWAFYRTVALPGALPSVWAGLRLGVGMALLLIVAAEMIAARSGIGWMIWTGYATFQLDRMFVAFVVMAFMGYVANLALDELERVFIPWKATGS